MSLRGWLITLLGTLALSAHAAPTWPEGKTSAIVLTYDDALVSQLDVAIPQLDKAGIKGTFFLDTVGDFGQEIMGRWEKVHQSGHELGNHSAFHPCPRAMLPDGGNGHFTEDYDVRQMLGEIYGFNLTLFLLDGEREHSYAAPCSQMIVGGVDYTEDLRSSRLVKYTRLGGDAYKSVITDFGRLDPMAVPSWGPIDSPVGAQLIAFVQRVEAAGGMGVLQFHGVGGDYLAVSAEAHRQLVEYLRTHPRVWVGTFREVMDYVTARNR